MGNGRKAAAQEVKGRQGTAELRVCAQLACAVRTCGFGRNGSSQEVNLGRDLALQSTGATSAA